jgi:phospholipid transport system transporter-binding protein
MTVAHAAVRASDSGDFRLVAAAGPGGLSAHGPLTFASARRACELGVEALSHASGPKLEIDCRGVSASDSAGLAVLLEWLAVAQRAGRSLRYTQLPEGLISLAQISEVDQLLERGV